MCSYLVKMKNHIKLPVEIVQILLRTCIVQCCLINVLLLKGVFSDWIEIPQSSKKSYLVTPYSPYIYTPSLVFKSTTTEAYNTILPLTRPKIYKDTKKSITKMPEDILRRTTTEIPFEKPSIRTTSKQNNRYSMTQNSESNLQVKKQTFPTINRKPNTTMLPTKDIKISPNPITITNKKDEVDEDIINTEEDEYEEVDEDDDLEPVYDDDEDSEYDDDDRNDQVDDEYYEDDEEYEEQPINSNEPKGNSHGSNGNEQVNAFNYANFMNYLQSIQNTLTKNPETNTVSNKLSFLTDIKNRLLFAIQSRINSIWQPRKKRQSRATRGDIWDSWEKNHNDHGMEFPSNEGALLTLGFLTFAVFLIKCILKLIHAIKGKHDKGSYLKPIIIVNGTVAPTGMNGMNGMMNTIRFKRNIDDLQIAKIMNNIETYIPH